MNKWVDEHLYECKMVVSPASENYLTHGQIV